MSNTGKITPASSVIAQRKGQRNSSPYMFPHTLGHHAMIINFKQYEYGNSSHARLLSQESIVLPLPKTLQDNLNIKVGADELGITGSLAAGGMNALTDFSGMGDVGAKFKSMFAKTTSEVEAVAAVDTIADAAGVASEAALFLARAGLGAIAPDIAKGIGAGNGTAINPYATLVFSGVDLKTHSFEWLLSPDTPEEAETLRRIIERIQHNITPEIKGVAITGGNETLSRGLLKYPSMVDCFFHGIDSNYFYQLKTSMISQFNVDYTPNGIALNRGGKPSAVRITLTMTEAAIHTKADYVIKTLAVDTGGAPESNPEQTVDPNVTPARDANGVLIPADQGDGS